MKIGMMELVVILLVAFFVLGPDKTVAYARKIGKGLRTLRIYVNSFTDDIRETVTEPLQDVAKAVQQPVDELKTAVWKSKTELNAPLAERPSQAAAEDTEVLEEAVPIKPPED